MRYLILFLTLSVVFVCAQKPKTSDDLRRKADLGIRLHTASPGPGAIIRTITAGSAAEKAGLKIGDKVIAINGTALPDSYTLFKTLRKIRGGDVVSLTLLRKTQNDPLIIQFTPASASYETYENLTLETIQLTNDYGDRLRGFLTKPKGQQGKLPAILFISWLSCSTVEAKEDPDDNWVKMLRDVAERSGALMLRIEKPGVGDSEGIACADCDLKRELNGYQAGLRYLKSRTDVDTTKLIIFGGSLGGTLGPFVGEGHSIKAYVSAVSVYKSWLEHMIEIERRRLTLSGKTAQVSADMQGLIELHTDYLTKQRTPAQILSDKPHLAPLWYDEPAHQYGRPASFYHQVQQLNFMEQWSKVTVPVLVVSGGLDWIMTLEDGRLLTDHLNARNPGQATWLVGESMDHHWAKYKSSADAFNEVNGSYDAETVNKMVEWIKGVISK